MAKMKKDLPCCRAAEEFLTWAKANKRLEAAMGYKVIPDRLQGLSGRVMPGGIHSFLIEHHQDLHRVPDTAGTWRQRGSMWISARRRLPLRAVMQTTAKPGPSR
jgi:hypothetical protein